MLSQPNEATAQLTGSGIVPRRRRRRTRTTITPWVAVATGVAIWASGASVTSTCALSSAATLSARASRVSSSSFTDAPYRSFDYLQHYEAPDEDYFDDDDEADGSLWDTALSSQQTDALTTTEESSFDIRAVKALQKSTGSDVLHSDLQQQIESGADAFLELHGKTALEKVAMSSITEQLPQAAVAAFQLEQQQQQPQQAAAAAVSRNHKEHAPTLHFQHSRVTPEEEIALARIIQQGAALHTIRSDLLQVSPRTPVSHKEWATAANLTPKQLRQTVSRYRQAKQTLVAANMGLVHAVVKQQQRKDGISYDELIQEGALGLVRAAELFDPTRGLRFSTYAVVWIKGVLSNTHVRELVKLPTRERTKYNKICKAERDLLQEPEGAATAKHLAERTGLSVGDVVDTKRRMQQANVLSLDYSATWHSRSGGRNDSGGATLGDLVVSDDADLAERTQCHADLVAHLAQNLNAREARLMRLRYGLSDGVPRTLQECADAMGLSYGRVHQLSKACLKKLRHAEQASSLQEYLLTIA